MMIQNIHIVDLSIFHMHVNVQGLEVHRLSFYRYNVYVYNIQACVSTKHAIE